MINLPYVQAIQILPLGLQSLLAIPHGATGILLIVRERDTLIMRCTSSGSRRGAHKLAHVAPVPRRDSNNTWRNAQTIKG
jgi:hypothetical protein